MAEKQSMAEVLEKNKRLRQELNSGAADPAPDTTLTVVNGAANGTSGDREQLTERTNEPSPAPVWVRHTLGLRAETSLALKEAADTQKKRKRRGLLQPGEPATEQEIAEMAISWVLKQIAINSPDQA